MSGIEEKIYSIIGENSEEREKFLALEEIQEMYEKVELILDESIEMFVTLDEKNLQEILKLENEIDEMERELQNNHVKRMSKGKCTPQAGIIFTDIVTGLERVADHATNIAFSIFDSDPEEDEV